MEFFEKNAIKFFESINYKHHHSQQKHTQSIDIHLQNATIHYN